jgi:hypothetical protein
MVHPPLWNWFRRLAESVYRRIDLLDGARQT